MRSSGFGLVLSILLLAACGGDDTTPPVISIDDDDGGMSNNGCVDEDNDGTGRRCRRPDCDDNDPEVTNECFLCTGSEPEAGCPCDEGTPPDIMCTPDNMGEQMMENGQLLECTEGQRYCHEPAGVEPGTFVWGECIGVFTIVN